MQVCGRVCGTLCIGGRARRHWHGHVHLPRRAPASSGGSGRASAGTMSVPKLFVFDLDNCVWYPEMYQLWGSSGPPFVRNADNSCDGHGGSGGKVELIGDVQEVIAQLVTDPTFKDTKLAVASCCDEPSWAHELLGLFEVVPGKTLQDCMSYVQIHKGNKQGHFRQIAKDSGVALEDMVFFDDQHGNIRNVSELGVTCVLTPDGVERKHFDQAMSQFASKK